MSRPRQSSWSKHYTDYGDEYFYDEEQGVSQWERPDEYISDTDTVDDTIYNHTITTTAADDDDGDYNGGECVTESYQTNSLLATTDVSNIQKYQNEEGVHYTDASGYGYSTAQPQNIEPVYEPEVSSVEEGTDYTDASGYGYSTAQPQNIEPVYEPEVSSVEEGTDYTDASGYGCSTMQPRNVEDNDSPTDEWSEADDVDTELDLEIIGFQLDEGEELLSELNRIMLFDPPTKREKRLLLSGVWNRVSCRKLEVLQFCLETAGTEEEWTIAFHAQDGILMSYLLLFMHESVHPLLRDGAARCLAYGTMAHPKLWRDYCQLSNSADHMVAVMGSAVGRIKTLVAMPPDARPNVPYAGFDERDIKDFNMEHMEEYDAVENEERGSCYMEGSTDSATTVAIWLLMLFQMFRVPTRLLGDEFRARRAQVQNVDSSGTQPQCTAHPTTDKFLSMLAELLFSSDHMKEDSYLLCIKTVAAVNWHLPAQINAGSTEVAELCASLQFEDDSSNINVSEGLMHLLNDIGYPEHDVPEALPCLKLCCDLISAPGYEGFFYVNDIKVLVEMIIREISNLPDGQSDSQSDSSEDSAYVSHAVTRVSVVDSLDGPVEGSKSDVPSHNELLRQMYLKVAIALMNHSCWKEIDDYYLKYALDDTLRSMVEDSHITHAKTLELVSEVLHQRLQSI